MKNKILVCVFRLSVIFAFVMGLVYAVKFVILGSQISTMSTSDGFNSLEGWSKTFFIYELICIIAAVLSIVTFKMTGIVSSAVRTLVLLTVTGFDLFAHKYVSIFSSFENAIDAIDEFRDIEDNGFTAILLSFAGVVLLLFVAITSIVSLIKLSKQK